MRLFLAEGTLVTRITAKNYEDSRALAGFPEQLHLNTVQSRQRKIRCGFPFGWRLRIRVPAAHGKKKCAK